MSPPARARTRLRRGDWSSPCRWSFQCRPQATRWPRLPRPPNDQPRKPPPPESAARPGPSEHRTQARQRVFRRAARPPACEQAFSSTSSVAGEGEGMADVVSRVVDDLWTREGCAEQDYRCQRNGSERREHAVSLISFIRKRSAWNEG